jgi:hypothetical protein
MGSMDVPISTLWFLRPADGTPFPSADELKKRIDNSEERVARIRKTEGKK